MSPGSPKVPMAASTLADLQTHLGTVTPIPNIKPQDAVVVRPAGATMDQLWVRPDYPSYRDAWRAAFGSVPASYHVDHLYSKARALQYGYAYVRLVLTTDKVNTSFGGGIEKKMTQVPTSPDESVPPRKVPIRYADWWQLKKINGVLLGGRAKGYRPTNVVLQPSILEGRFKGASARPARRLKYTSVQVSPKGAAGWSARKGGRSYDFLGGLVGLVMDGAVASTNSYKESQALSTLKPRVEQMMPDTGGVLVALVYQEPGNASQYSFSTELFMYAYILDAGSTAEAVFQDYQLRVQRTGTLSPAANPNWIKRERYLWFSAE